MQRRREKNNFEKDKNNPSGASGEAPWATRNGTRRDGICRGWARWYEIVWSAVLTTLAMHVPGPIGKNQGYLSASTLFASPVWYWLLARRALVGPMQVPVSFLPFTTLSKEMQKGLSNGCNTNTFDFLSPFRQCPLCWCVVMALAFAIQWFWFTIFF